MGIHVAEQIPDNQKTVERHGSSGGDRKEFPALTLNTVLGIYARTAIWEGAERQLADTGGHAVMWTRDFARQHITSETCAHFLEMRFPGFVEAGNTLLAGIKGSPLVREETVQFKAYRYTHSGFKDREKGKLTLGPRYWANNAKMNPMMRVLNNLLLEHGPRLQFDFDIHNPEKTPTIRRTK